MTPLARATRLGRFLPRMDEEDSLGLILTVGSQLAAHRARMQPGQRRKILAEARDLTATDSLVFCRFLAAISPSEAT